MRGIENPIKVSSILFDDKVYPAIRPLCSTPCWEGSHRYFRDELVPSKVYATEMVGDFFVYVRKDILDSLKGGVNVNS